MLIQHKDKVNYYNYNNDDGHNNDYNCGSDDNCNNDNNDDIFDYTIFFLNGHSL